jgi:spermidine synthase
MEDILKLFMINNNGYFDESAPLQKSSTRYQIETCVVCEKTPFAETVIVKSADYGSMLFLDNELQSTSYDEKIYHETLVHPIMNVFSAVENKHILVIGGAEGATVREVLKWDSIKMVEWVDIDNRLVELCKTHLQYTPASVYSDSRLFHFGDDIMHHLALVTDPIYDIIIIDLPDPDPEMGTPLYGPEFWELMRKSLKPGGGMVTHTGPVEPGLGRQVGMKMVQDGVGVVGHPYHSMIPSFQGEWGFWMNIVPSRIDSFPASCEIMNLDYQKTIFHWDKHWSLNFSA